MPIDHKAYELSDILSQLLSLSACFIFWIEYDMLWKLCDAVSVRGIIIFMNVIVHNWRVYTRVLVSLLWISLNTELILDMLLLSFWWFSMKKYRIITENKDVQLKIRNVDIDITFSAHFLNDQATFQGHKLKKLWWALIPTLILVSLSQYPVSLYQLDFDVTQDMIWVGGYLMLESESKTCFSVIIAT